MNQTKYLAGLLNQAELSRSRRLLAAGDKAGALAIRVAVFADRIAVGQIVLVTR